MNDLTILQHIQYQAVSDNIRYTLHAQQKMVEDNYSRDDIHHAIATGRILESYPEHQRGACCLLYGVTDIGRNVHIVCTTVRLVLIIITVYDPIPPKWPTPTQRRKQ